MTNPVLPHATKKAFFPARHYNGVLFIGEETEFFLDDRTGSAMWHYRRDWERGPQQNQPSNIPSDLALDFAHSIEVLLDSDEPLQDLLVAEISRLLKKKDGDENSDKTHLTLNSWPISPSPYEPRKGISQDGTIELVVPGGYKSDKRLTFVAKRDVLGLRPSESKASWSLIFGNLDIQDTNLPSDVVDDVIAVIERQFDRVVWCRDRLAEFARL